MTDELTAAIERLIAALPPHKAGLSIHHNEHLTYYETAKAYTDDIARNIGGMDWASDEERAQAYEKNELWEVHWYPNTPVGSCSVYGATLEGVLRRVMEDA